MGSTNSLPVPRYGCCIRPHNPDACVENHAARCVSTAESQRSSRSTRSHHRRNLSATFNFTDSASDFDYRPALAHDLININTATEEELMTLTAVNRATAHNIVEYRRLLVGGFRKVEDLALVSGVGAMRLSVIRGEITVGVNRRGGSQPLSKNSSTSSSGIDLTMPPDDVSHGSVGGPIVVSVGANTSSRVSAPPSRDVKVNVNTANVFQLMKVNLITQALAENIVDYRSRRGRFTTIDDLVKVKGVKSGLVGAIRQNLVLDEEPVVFNAVNPTADSVDNSKKNYNAAEGSQSCKSLSRLEYGEGLDDVQQELVSLYGPLLRKSFRISTQRARPRTSRGALRIATWNLQRCGVEKAKNHGVREVVSMTILENDLSIVAVQDLLDDKALQLFCDEINSPTLPAVKNWSGSKGHWSCCSQPIHISSTDHSTSQRCYLGFMYDQSRCSLSDSFVRPDSELDQTACSFLAFFKVKNFRLAIVNVQLNNTLLTSKMSDYFDSIDACNLDGNFTVAAGQLEPISSTAGSLYGIAGDSRTLKSVLDASQHTDISPRNLSGSICSQNIWFKSSLQHLCTGNGEVIRDGLSSPWIPDGWSWGGMVSDCCPVCIDVRTLGADAQHITEADKLSDDTTEKRQSCH